MLTHVHKIRVEYEDVDICEVLYHPNYLKYSDRARNAFFENKGFPFDSQFREKVGFTILGINCTFLKSLSFGDYVNVTTSIKKIGKTSLTLLHTIYLDDPAELNFKAEYKLVFVDIKLKKSITIPQDLKEEFLKGEDSF